jgi:hypothetical protein
MIALLLQVNVFPDLGYIAWAGSNSARAEDDDMVHEIVAALPTYTFIDCSSSAPTADEVDDDESLTTGQVAGLVVGGIVCGALITVVLFYSYKSFISERHDGAMQDSLLLS